MVVQYRREDVADATVKGCTNASLWLDKYFNKHDDKDEQAKQSLVTQIVEEIQVDSAYHVYFHAWQKALERAEIKTKVAHTLGRLAVNLGAESILETSIALHHTYGVPYIPGSALKGLAAHFADQNLEAYWKKGEEAHRIMFGDTDNAGYITFFDALYVPGSGKDGRALWKDVITVHHAEYYQTGEKPPADWDGTTIIPFISATGSFLVALAGPSAWVDKAFEILALALEKEGIGAKTSSGYGRMSFESQRTSASATALKEQSSKKEELLREFPQGNRIRGEVIGIKRDGVFGVIKPATGEAEIDSYYKNISGGDDQKFEVGQIVEYAKASHQGKPQAMDVKILLQNHE